MGTAWAKGPKPDGTWAGMCRGNLVMVGALGWAPKAFLGTMAFKVSSRRLTTTQGFNSQRDPDSRIREGAPRA